MSEPTQHTRHFADLWFTVVATLNKDSVTFVVYQIHGYEQGNTPGVFDLPCWPLRSADPSEWPTRSATSSLVDAEIYLHGDIKWQGSSNWHFDEQDRVMLHACDREELTRLGEIMVRCWDWMPELCPTWNPL